MRFLKEHPAVENFFGVACLVCTLMYVCLAFVQLVNVYAPAALNAERLAQNWNVWIVTGVEEESEGVFRIHTVDGVEMVADHPTSGLALSKENAMWYSQEDNCLMQATGKRYWITFFQESHLPQILMTTGVLNVFIGVCSKAGGFDSKNEKWLLKAWAVVDVLLALLCGVVMLCFW